MVLKTNTVKLHNNEKLNTNTEITMVYKCVLDVNVTCTQCNEYR